MARSRGSEVDLEAGHIGDATEECLRGDGVGHAAQVVGDAGPEGDAANVASSAVVVEDADDAAGAFEFGGSHVPALGQGVVVGGAGDGDGLGVWGAGADGAQGDDQFDVDGVDECGHGSEVAFPTAVRFDALSDDAVASVVVAVCEFGGGPDDDAFVVFVACHGARFGEVVEFFGVDGGEGFAAHLAGEVLCGGGGGFRGVVPAFPGHD